MHIWEVLLFAAVVGVLALWWQIRYLRNIAASRKLGVQSQQPPSAEERIAHLIQLRDRR